MADFGQDIVDRGLERLRGTWTYDGEEYDLIVEDISYPDFKLAQQYGAISAQLANAESADDLDAEALNEQAENLGTFSWEDEGNERDFVPGMIDAKLVKPDVAIDNTSTAKLRALVEGMMSTWSEAEDVAKARDEMPLEGNA